MIRTRTVFVLGAGASIPFGFPSGLSLFKEVLRLPENISEMNMLNECGFMSDQIDDFKENLKHSGRMSVDAFLETRPDYIKIGKALMALALSSHEKTSSLFDPDNKEKNLYDYLLASIATANPEEIRANAVSFVTFNYDRSLEMYLGSAFESNYNNTPPAAQLLRSIPIIHVHGKIGNLPVEGGKTKRYTPQMTLEEFKVAQNGIRIIHEMGDEEEGFKQARILLKEAEQIVFVGFGYLETNLVRLRLMECRQQPVYFGTGFNLTAREIDFVRDMFNRRIEIRDNDALSFLRETGVLLPVPRIVVAPDTE